MSITNRNPGNIRYTADTSRFLGCTGSSPAGFCLFDTAANGLRAIGVNLQTYQTKYRINTIAATLRHESINRWAPPSENDTQAYIDDVARRTGFSSLQVLNFFDLAILQAMVTAIVWHENGECPYSASVIAFSLCKLGRKP